MTKELLGKTKNGYDVYFDAKKSHALTHFNKTPKLIEYVKKLLPTIEATEDMIRLDSDMGEIVGNTDLIETDEGDEIVYAMRPLRAQFSRFVKNKESQPTSWITIDLRKSGGDEYFLYTAFVGRLTPSFPGGSFLPERSRDFWAKHALVWGAQEIVPGSETTKCPW